MEDFSLASAIKNLDEFQLRPDLADLAMSIFEYTQFLLDKDENLTKTGNLNSKAVTILQERILELLSIKETVEETEMDA